MNKISLLLHCWRGSLRASADPGGPVGRAGRYGFQPGLSGRGAGVESYRAHKEDSSAAPGISAATSQGLKAFHDFQFADGYPQSQITFTNRVVDDAAKDWKPAHYDHGNAVAVADVDGDGRLDIYFTTQLGENQLWRNLGTASSKILRPRPGWHEGFHIRGAAFADIDNDGHRICLSPPCVTGIICLRIWAAGISGNYQEAAASIIPATPRRACFLILTMMGWLICSFATWAYSPRRERSGWILSGLTNAFSGHLFPERTEHSILYKNLGNRRFKDVTREMNLVSPGAEATTVDLNGDGYPDVYLTNMQGDNHYFENQKGKSFVEKTAHHFPKPLGAPCRRSSSTSTMTGGWTFPWWTCTVT